MARYFLEVAYQGTAYSGFQIQENAVTIQSEVEKAFATLHRQRVQMTGSSRTDAGVHAYQNFFHFDYADEVHPQAVYKLNAILPPDIVIRSIRQVAADAHCRFDAIQRRYVYHLHRFKNPFVSRFSLYYPYQLDVGEMRKASDYILQQTEFFAFSKTNTQVRNFRCRLCRSEWVEEGESLRYHIEGDRFLRGMVRLLTATQLKIGRGLLSFAELETLFTSACKCGHSIPAVGLVLAGVQYPGKDVPSPSRL